MSLDSPRLRLGVLGVVVVSLFATMVARLWYLQVLAVSSYRDEAQHNSVRLIEREAPRGRILDVNGRPLADNRTVDAVTVTREEVRRHPDLLPRLAGLLAVPLADMQRRIDDQRYSPFQPVPVAEDVTKDALVAIRERSAEFPGVQGVRLTERTYPQGGLAAHLLGYVGAITDKELAARKGKGYSPGDTIGKGGVELAYENDLRGRAAQLRVEVDSQGHVLSAPSAETRPAVQGHDVQLTVDLDVQRLAEDSLAEGLQAVQQHRRYPAPAGAVVVLDPQDGSVRALASFPSFNPNDFVNGISTELFRNLQDPANHFPLNNRAIQGLYAPGSTFKLVTSIAGLEKGLITPSRIIEDKGSVTIGPQVFRNALGRSYGPVNLAKAITVSSDVYFYTVGSDFWNLRSRYPTAIQQVARSMGMGAPTGIELPFEAPGRVPDPDGRKRLHDTNPKAFPNGSWFTGDNVNLAIGQGELVVTPLQLANAYATFANGGTVMAPHVGSVVRDQQGVVLRHVPSRVVRRVSLPPSVRAPILQGLQGVVVDPKGTAVDAFAGFPYGAFPVGGKTGTAQVFGQQDTALFCAIGPLPTSRYAVAVIMEQAGLGAQAAAPVARRILEGLAGLPAHPVTLSSGDAPD